MSEDRDAVYSIARISLGGAALYAAVVLVFLWATGGLNGGTPTVETASKPGGGSGAARRDTAVATHP